MRWSYYIPHVWNSPSDRTTWEDVWLRLEEQAAEGGSLWLTFDAGKTDEEVAGAAAAWQDARADHPQRDLLGRWLQLDDKEFLITPDLDIWIRQGDFDLPELLDWVRVFIGRFFADLSPELVEGTFEEFADSNQHARTIGGIGANLEAEVASGESGVPPASPGSPPPPARG